MIHRHREIVEATPPPAEDAGCGPMPEGDGWTLTLEPAAVRDATLMLARLYAEEKGAPGKRNDRPLARGQEVPPGRNAIAKAANMDPAKLSRLGKVLAEDKAVVAAATLMLARLYAEERAEPRGVKPLLARGQAMRTPGKAAIAKAAGMDASASELAACVATLGEGEVRVLLALARRLQVGQRAYGRLDLAHDGRDWRAERAAELADALIYGAIGEVALELASGQTDARIAHTEPVTNRGSQT